MSAYRAKKKTSSLALAPVTALHVPRLSRVRQPADADSTAGAAAAKFAHRKPAKLSSEASKSRVQTRPALLPTET